MIELWIPVTVLAATIQAARTTVQKHLKGTLRTNSITFARYFYGLPFVLLYLAVVAGLSGAVLPAPTRCSLPAASWRAFRRSSPPRS